MVQHTCTPVWGCSDSTDYPVNVLFENWTLKSSNLLHPKDMKSKTSPSKPVASLSLRVCPGSEEIHANKTQCDLLCLVTERGSLRRLPEAKQAWREFQGDGGYCKTLANSSLNPLMAGLLDLYLFGCASQIQHFPVEKAIGWVSVNTGSGCALLLCFHATTSDEPVLL